MGHLFKHINENFFNVLSSPNKHIYVDCIFIIYEAIDSVEDAFQGDRDKIVQRLQDYFDDSDKHQKLESDVASELTNTSRQKANHVINLLKRNGWLGEEELGNYRTSLNFFDYSIKIIETMKSIVDRTQNEYTGEIYAVYSLLESYETAPDTEGLGILEQAFSKTNDILRKLKSLKANIYRYYYDITQDRNRANLQDLLEKLLVEYKENFFDSAYYNLKTKDSLPRYKRAILSQISKLYNNDDTMEMLTNQVRIDKKIIDYNEAYLYVEERMRHITDSFSALDNLINEIDRKNEQYISATASKVLFLTNHSEDIEGVFNRLFKIILGTNEVGYDDLFNLTNAKNLDTESLYTQRRHRIDSIPETLIFDDSLISEEYRKQKLEILLRNNQFGKKEINKYVLNLLDTKEFIEAARVPLFNQEEYIKLIMIFLYSKSVGMSYDIELLGTQCRNNFAVFENFLIKRRGVIVYDK